MVFGKDFQDKMNNLRDVFTRLRKANLKLKPSKCHFFQNQVTFLGHVISKDGIKPDPKNVEKILHWPTPRSVTEVRSFLGLSSYYRRFVKNFARKAAPLHELTKKDVPFHWNEQCEESFQ